MNKLAIFVLTLFVIAGPSSAAIHKKRTRSARHTAVKTGVKTRRASASRYRSRSKARPTAVTSRTRYSLPSGPTPERYKEIQQSLAAKGYYSGEVNGQWTQESADAMKRFQADQNLTSDGKINSLSLIALGLGPKRTLSAQAAKPVQARPGTPQPQTPEAGAQP